MIRRLFAAFAQRAPVLLGGTLAAFAMPGMGFPGVCVVLGLAVLAWRGRSRRSAFADGWCFAFAYFAAGLYWIDHVVRVHGYQPWLVSLTAVAVLSAFLAVYTGLAQVLAVTAESRWTPPLWAAAIAIAEDARGQVLTGFAWNPFALAFAPTPAMAAPAAFVGATGLTFLTALAAAALAQMLRRETARNGVRWLAITTGVWVVLAVMRPVAAPDRPPLLDVAVIQGNVDQTVKWDPAYRDFTLNIYEDLTRRAVRHVDPAPDLVVWPETAMPFYYQQPSPHREWVERIVGDLNVPLLSGAPGYRFLPDQEWPDLFNRAYLLDPQGEIVGQYDKMHLVPFGEYVPLRGVFFFLDKLVEGTGDFATGAGRFPLPLGRHNIGVLICYEAVFPYEVRQYIAAGAELLVQITNDAWFGPTAASQQHLALAQLRVIENGIPLARAANTGVSGFIEADGSIHDTASFGIPAWRRRVLHVGTPTFFARHGWVWRWWWAALGVAWTLWVARQWWRCRRIGGALAAHPKL